MEPCENSKGVPPVLQYLAENDVSLEPTYLATPQHWPKNKLANEDLIVGDWEFEAHPASSNASSSDSDGPRP
jgi:hypothetical protein